MKTALVLACDDNFIAYASIVACRVAQLSSEEFPIVIVSDGVTEENKRRAQQFCPRITFVEAGKSFEGHDFPLHGFTRTSYARLFLDELLADFDRAVYFDCDITPLVDVSPLLALSPTKAPMMAAYDLPQLMARETMARLLMPPTAGYFNSGVVVFDLKAVRAERVFADAIAYAKKNPEKCLIVDQDALNAVINGRWQVLDWRWNVLSQDAQFAPGPFLIRHHGGGKPWGPIKGYCEKPIVEFWRKALSESPWPEKYVLSPPDLTLKHARRRLYYSIVDALGLTSKRRAAEKARMASYAAQLPQYLAKIDDLARRDALAEGL